MYKCYKVFGPVGYLNSCLLTWVAQYLQETIMPLHCSNTISKFIWQLATCNNTKIWAQCFDSPNFLEIPLLVEVLHVRQVLCCENFRADLIWNIPLFNTLLYKRDWDIQVDHKMRFHQFSYCVTMYIIIHITSCNSKGSLEVNYRFSLTFATKLINFLELEHKYSTFITLNHIWTLSWPNSIQSHPPITESNVKFLLRYSPPLLT